MFYLSGSNQEGLLINPTHRVLNNVQSIDKIISSIKSNFLTESLEHIKEDELLSEDSSGQQEDASKIYLLLSQSCDRAIV